MARENLTWGSERIRGELLKLGIVVSKRSVQRYRQRGPARPPSQTWRTFLANQVGHLRAADLSTGADADVSAALRGAAQPPPEVPSPAGARVGDPERRSPGAPARRSATRTTTAQRARPSRGHLEQRMR